MELELIARYNDEQRYVPESIKRLAKMRMDYEMYDDFDPDEEEEYEEY